MAMHLTAASKGIKIQCSCKHSYKSDPPNIPDTEYLHASAQILPGELICSTLATCLVKADECEEYESILL